MNERQTNYTIAEGYELPSKGIIYNTKVNPNVELRSMTAKDEMKRLAPSNLPYKVLADIIEGCMIEKPAVHVYDMALGDYEYLLHRLRVVTYGDLYKMTIKCPNCGQVVDAEAHLNELQLKEFDEEIYDKLKNVTLPDSGKAIGLKFQTPRMLDERESKIRDFKKRFKDIDYDARTFISIIQTIDTVDEVELKLTDLEQFVFKLTARDLLAIQQAGERLTNSIGLDTSIDVICDECGEEVNTFFRFGPNFFRPDVI